MKTDVPSILIVDDREANLLVLQRTLAEFDVEIVGAASGEQALARCLEHDFALAILDVQMPLMDGFELAGFLRGDPGTRNMPIIFLTANSNAEEQIFAGYEAGAVDYIVKPFEPKILCAKVRMFLEMDSYRRDLARHRDHLDQLVGERTAELEEANESLRRSNAELEQFAYVASHDLQEPLRRIATFSGLLARRYQGRFDEKADRYLEAVNSGALRMLSLIDDLLKLSRIGTREKPESVADSGKILATVLEDLSGPINETGATIEYGDLPVVGVDPGLLYQVFSNLIGNAIKFAGDEKPRVRVEATRKEGNWEFSVADRGIGIDPAHQEKIFVIFQRLHAREAYPGSGIGLAVVKKIVERYGGAIAVESQPGQGATFRFTLPAASRPEG
jgi:two-component system sensor histidine kinase/response regulator